MTLLTLLRRSLLKRCIVLLAVWSALASSAENLQTRLDGIYQNERRRAFEDHCTSRRQHLEREDASGSEWPRTVAFPVLMLPNDETCRGKFGVEIPWKVAFESRGFQLVNDTAIATFVISKQFVHSAVGFGNTCPDTQIFNQIDGISALFNNKRRMWQTFLDFEASQEDPSFKAASFSPGTYTISEADQCKNWLQQVRETPDDSWLLKIADKDNQQGVSLMEQAELDKFKQSYATDGQCTGNWQMLAQHMVHPPLLIDGNKFDMRVYVMIASTEPMLAFIHPVLLVRRSNLEYSMKHLFTQMGKDVEKDGHNQMHPLSLAEKLHWSHARLARFYKKVKIMVSKFVGILKSKATRQPGHFTMLGLDIIAGADEEIWFLEANSSPEIAQPNRHPWRLAFQEEMLEEVVDVQLAVTAARRESHRHAAGLVDVAAEVAASARRFEVVHMERPDGSSWSYHLDGTIDEVTYATRLEYLHGMHTDIKADTMVWQKDGPLIVPRKQMEPGKK